MATRANIPSENGTTPPSAPPAGALPLQDDENIDVATIMATQAAPTALQELKLSRDPSRFSFFAAKGIARTHLHFEDHEAVRGYFRCQGDGCPHCMAELKPSSFLLFPVFNHISQRVEVLRVLESDGANRLLSLLRPLLADPDAGNKVVTATRDGAKYTVSFSDIPDAGKRGARAIKEFLEARASGRIKLGETFPLHPPAVLASLPHIKNHLATLGLDIDDGGLISLPEADEGTDD